jgi:drug/metabolite transporter (DMT)-like permease
MYPLTPMVMNKGMASNTIVMFKGLLFLICCCIFFRKTIAEIKRRDLLYALLSGLCNMAGNIFQTLGMTFTSPSSCAFLTITNVVMVPFVSLLFFREKPTKRNLLCFPLCMLGVALLTGILETGIEVNIGDMFSFGGALCFAFTITLVAHGKMDFKVIAFGLAVTQFLGGLVAMVMTGETIAAVDWGFAVPSLLYLGVIATFLAASIQCYVQKYISSISAAIIMTMESVFGCFFSILMGMEFFTFRLFWGGFLIIISIVSMEIRFSPFWQKSNRLY